MHIFYIMTCYNVGVIKASYIQGETIRAEASASDAVACIFRWYPVRSDALKTSASALLASQKHSLSVGEISMSDKTADELAALAGLVDASTPARGGSAQMSLNRDTWSASVNTDEMFGEYKYAILAEGQDGSRDVVDSGTFSVEGDSRAAGMGGGISVLNVRFV